MLVCHFAYSMANTMLTDTLRQVGRSPCQPLRSCSQPLLPLEQIILVLLSDELVWCLPPESGPSNPACARGDSAWEPGAAPHLRESPAKRNSREVQSRSKQSAPLSGSWKWEAKAVPVLL